MESLSDKCKRGKGREETIIEWADEVNKFDLLNPLITFDPDKKIHMHYARMHYN